MNALKEWAQGIDLTWIITNLMVVVCAVISLSFHEFSHAFAAYQLGDDLAKRMGRLTLNPLKHLSVVGVLMLAVFKFGWAKPVPIDMRRFKNPKAGMALTALAGPVSNVLLAFLSCLILSLLFRAYRDNYRVLYSTDSAGYYIVLFFVMLAMLNAGLAVFNLIPISPLDGSKVLAIILPDTAYLWLMKYERYGMFVLMALLFSNLLDKPLDFLRTGLLHGLSWLSNLPFGNLPNPLLQIF